MNCMKCGRETENEAVFCPDCLQIMEKYPVPGPSKLTSDNDQRRIRAISVAVLEQEALNGHTIMPRDLLVNKVNELILEPACHVTTDIMKAILGEEQNSERNAVKNPGARREFDMLLDIQETLKLLDF